MDSVCIASLLVVFTLFPPSQAIQNEVVVYGKYYSISPGVNEWGFHKGAKTRIDNSYFVYKPDPPPLPAQTPCSALHKFPVVFQAYGNFWAKPYKGGGVGPKTHVEPYIEQYVNSGIAYVSTGYRGVNYLYHYDDAGGTTKAEELIHVDAEGKLTLDTTGLTIRDYKVRACWMELITKCVYDTVQAFENLIANADLHGVDVHRVFFQGSSAGSSVLNYLTWVYHKWNKERYTPQGLMLENPQFDLPIRCMMYDGSVLKTYMDHSDAGSNLLMRDVVERADCELTLGCASTNPSACNKSFNEASTKRFCNHEFDTLTFGQVYETQRLNEEDAQVGLGMKKLWHTSQNMMDYQPRPFHLYVSSKEHGVAHGGMSAFSYAELADELGLNYTAYYLDQPGRRKTTATRFAARIPHIEMDFGGGLVLMYRSSFPWAAFRKSHDIPSVIYDPIAEHINYISLVLGIPLPQMAPVSSRLYKIERESARVPMSIDNKPEQTMMMILGISALFSVVCVFAVWLATFSKSFKRKWQVSLPRDPENCPLDETDPLNSALSYDCADGLVA